MNEELEASSELVRAIADIEAIHSADPELSEHKGQTLPYALIYARRMHACLLRLEPDASLALKVAAFAQHLGRWQVPRASFPNGKAGYFAWRQRMAKHQAKLVHDTLLGAGLDGEFANRVANIVAKNNLRYDAEVQTLEDVACLVFLEHELEAFAAKHAEEKVIDILRKTWKKISPRGQAAALSIKLNDEAARLLALALA